MRVAPDGSVHPFAGGGSRRRRRRATRRRTPADRRGRGRTRRRPVYRQRQHRAARRDRRDHHDRRRRPLPPTRSGTAARRPTRRSATSTASRSVPTGELYIAGKRRRPCPPGRPRRQDLDRRGRRRHPRTAPGTAARARRRVGGSTAWTSLRWGLYFTERNGGGNLVRRLGPDGTITTAAGRPPATAAATERWAITGRPARRGSARSSAWRSRPTAATTSRPTAT